MNLDEIADCIDVSREVLSDGLEDHDAMLVGQFLRWIKQDDAPPWWSVPELANMVS